MSRSTLPHAICSCDWYLKEHYVVFKYEWECHIVWNISFIRLEYSGEFKYTDNKIIPGQSLSKQEWICVAFPGHMSPPCCGAGLVQVRLRDLYPTPHDVEHDVQFPQAVQPPSTFDITKSGVYKFKN